MTMERENHLYFLRHCKTANNNYKIITGQIDIPIIDNAEVNIGQFTGRDNVQIICSPLMRCRQTVSILIDNLKFCPEVQIENALSERNMGDFEGMMRRQAVSEYPEYFFNNKFIYSMTPPNGEGFVHLCERADFIIHELVWKKLRSRDIILCSHNHLLKVVYFKIMNIQLDREWYQVEFENGSIYKII